MDATVCSSRRGPSVTPSRSHQLTFRMGHEQLVMYTLLAFIAGSAIAQLSYAQMGQPGRDLQTMPTHCHPLSKDLLSKIAVDNHVLISVMDEMVWHIYGKSWVRNVQQAGITYFSVAALDPTTSIALGALGVTANCFNAPLDRLRYKGTAAQKQVAKDGYKWGSHHWHMTTWNKVHIMRAIYDMGFHIIHSDADVTWFKDPLPFFKPFLGTEKHTLFATDMTTTHNEHGEKGIDVERESHPYVNINTGVYWVQQWPAGRDFYTEWIRWQDKNVGHDQDGLNYVARGRVFRGDDQMPSPLHEPHVKPKMFLMAHNKSAGISFLPGSSFGNAYTYVNTRLHERLGHPLYMVHWVWGGSTLEAKQQNMRDALKFYDAPEYYTSPSLVTFDLDFLPMPIDFNIWPDTRTEEMIRFHIDAANHQLQQAYYAFAAALVFNRTLVLPRYRCYCSKNWYMTQACRINNEQITQFPFVCALSQLMRVKKLSKGLHLQDRIHGGMRVAHVREYSFLENARVPTEIKNARLVIAPLAEYQRSESVSLESLQAAVKSQDHGNGTVSLHLPWPLDDQELRTLLEPHNSKRIMHFTNATLLLGKGFRNPAMATDFDDEMSTKVTHWCCRSPADQQKLKLPDRIQLQILPPSRRRKSVTGAVTS